MRDPDFWNNDDSSLWIDLHLGDRRRTTEGRRRTDRRSFVLSRRGRRLVRAGRTQCAELFLGEPHGVDETHSGFRILDIKNTPIRKYQPAAWDTQFFRRRLPQKFPRPFGSLDRGIAGHERDAAGVAAEIHRSEIGISRDDS